jgi:teichuronic acid biosynthesis glycosyltransferase TuaC
VTGLAASRLARRTGLPLVLTFHGSDMNSWPETHPERMSDLRSAVRGAGAVIAVSAALVDQIRNVTGVTAIHLPIGSDHRSLAAAALPRAEARRLFGFPDDRTVVLFVGNLKRSKGIRLLADAILGLGDPFLGVFVGDGPEAGYGTDDSRAANLLDYRGAKPHDEVVRYLSAADVLVLPSYGEGLPTVLVEAGSLGIPVIASPVGGVPELLGVDRGAMLTEITASAVADALTHFQAHRPEAAAAAERSRQHVINRYDVDRNAARLLDCYRSVIAGLPAHGPSSEAAGA